MDAWLQVLIAVVGGSLGTQGIQSLLRIRHDKRMGVRTTEIAEDAQDDAHWKSIIETQTVSLLKPLQEQVNAQGKEIAELRVEVRVISAKYWRAIHYVRTLRYWIERHFPTADPPPPVIPPELSDDI